MITRIALLVIFITISLNTLAQKEANIWYFGQHAGLDFNGSSPKLINSPRLNQLEGCATISDKSGNLLFYTDGITVWNKMHQIMPNGTGLLGDNSSTQSALIVPIPNNGSLFYIFTVPTWEPVYEHEGLRYSLVNMALNGGLGVIVEKNILLVSGTTEKLAAVKHCNNTDVWIMTTIRHTNSFYAINVTEKGICTYPVVSKAGQMQRQFQGHLKFSPDGTKLVTVMPMQDTEIFNFDRNSGKVTYWKAIPGTISSGSAFGESYYGASFSPDGTKLYLSSGWFPAIDASCEKLVQYDLNVADITTSRTIIYDNSGANPGSCLSWGVGALQLGPDGKIYVTSWTSESNAFDYLHVIANPNQAGTACNFIKNGFHLEGKLGSLGLPNFIESYFDSSGGTTTCTTTLSLQANFTHQVACTNQPMFFTNQSSSNLGDYKSYWDFGDPRSNQDTSTLHTPTHYYDLPGTYTVTLVVQSGIGCKTDTIRKQVEVRPSPLVSLSNDTTLCEGETMILDATIPNVTYRWQDGSTNATFQVTQPGRYEVSMRAANGCTSTETIQVSYASYPLVSLGKDTTLCEGETLTLQATNPGATYLWQDNSTSSTFKVTQPGIYWVEVTTNNCSIRDSIEVIYNPLPTVDLGNHATILCEGETITLDATTSNATYLWQDNTTKSTYEVTQPGRYWVQVTVNNCSVTDTIEVINPMTINLGNDTTLCLGKTMLLNATTPNATYLWQDNSTNPTFNVTQAGTYWVEVTIQGCSIRSQINIQERDCDIYLVMPNLLTPNQDGKNDLFVPIRSNGIASMNTRIYNRWGNQVFSTNNPKIAWDGLASNGSYVPNGVYFWVVKYIDIEGQEVTMNGQITVLR